jgi:hypothetical protein
MRTWLVSIVAVAALAGAALPGGAQAQSQASLLHDALHLTPAQEDAWRTYQRRVGGDPQDQARSRQTQAMLPTLPTPRRLALIRAQMEADLTAFDRRAQAVTAFYAGLGPDQQRIFDRQTAAGVGPP